MKNSFCDFTTFLSDLERLGISYTLAHNRDDAIMVIAAAPGERWEIEYFNDGSVEIERFRSNGEIVGVEALSELFSRYSDHSSKDYQSTEAPELVTAGKE